MVRRKDELSVDVKNEMRGGKGEVVLESILNKSEMYDKGRLFSKITLKPGCSIGYHVHENEMEAFYIIKGTASYNDNGTNKKLYPGDATLTISGECHEISNDSDEDTEIIALIIYK